MLTGGRSFFALDVARRFHETGHQVFVAETSPYHVCRFSNAVKKNYVIPSPRFQSKSFIQAIIDICIKEKIDLVIPTFEEIFCLSKGISHFPKGCTVFCEDYETLDKLHNKWLFNKKIKTLGFKAPRSYLIHNQEELEQIPSDVSYILKPCYSRAALKIQKVSIPTIPKIEIDPRNPLVAQEFIYGKFCTYSIAHGGKLTAHAVYPQDFSIDNHSCLNFVAIHHPSIKTWVQTFVKKEHFTGQIAFDFIETRSGDLFAIECNPRGTHGLNLFQKKDNLPEAFFNTSNFITPTLGFSKQLFWGMLLYGWKNRNFFEFLRKWVRVSDIIFSKEDLKPFFFQPFLFMVYFYRSLKRREPLPAIFTFDVDWDGQATSNFEQILQEEFR